MSGGFSFGQGSGGFSFGQNTTAAPTTGFGMPTATTAPSGGGFTFGAAAAQPSTNSTGGFAFGTPANSSASGGGFSFGTPTTSFGLGAAPQTTTAAGLTLGSTPAAATGFSLGGGLSTQSTAAPATGGLVLEQSANNQRQLRLRICTNRLRRLQLRHQSSGHYNYSFYHAPAAPSTLVANQLPQLLPPLLSLQVFLWESNHPLHLLLQLPHWPLSLQLHLCSLCLRLPLAVLQLWAQGLLCHSSNFSSSQHCSSHDNSNWGVIFDAETIRSHNNHLSFRCCCYDYCVQQQQLSQSGQLLVLHWGSNPQHP
ncbi:hypothetical protein WMY93_002897 [Mugilogobius chulae]|uniref:Uncharacterized protein n=1 Tax=Mugilogobius chulae TaxID=88201 RepID=A0AAW0Q0X4_9GOBI